MTIAGYAKLVADRCLDETKINRSDQSPFLPGTNIQYAWDSTSLGWFKTCPRLYQYSMLEGWVPKSESVHLRFGLEYHAALQGYAIDRANGATHETAVQSAIYSTLERIADWNVDIKTKAGKYKNRETLIQLIIDYLDHYIDDPCETYILEDGSPAVELSFKFELEVGPQQKVDWVDNDTVSASPQPYILCGHLDRVVRFNDQLFVMDHKTTTTTPGSYYFDQYEPHNQMTLYTIAGQVVLNAVVKGVIISAAQILLEKPNAFVRGFTYRTPDQLDEWINDALFWFSLAETYVEANYWPQNDTACDKYGGCKFREVCSKSPQVREKFLSVDFIKLSEEERWNPMKSR